MSEVVPAGNNVLHIHRVMVSGGPIRGGCLAIIHQNTLPILVHPLGSVSPPSKHERQIVRIVGVGTSSAVTVVNIFRPPSGSIPEFLIELGDFLATLISSSTDRLILCSNYNCPGDDSNCFDDSLQGVLDSFGLVLPSMNQRIPAISST